MIMVRVFKLIIFVYYYVIGFHGFRPKTMDLGLKLQIQTQNHRFRPETTVSVLKTSKTDLKFSFHSEDPRGNHLFFNLNPWIPPVDSSTDLT